MAVASALVSPCYAGGFMVPEQGASAVGMGNAFTSIANDPSANWYNPAGLAFLGTSVSVGGDLLRPNNQYTTGGTTYNAKKKTFFAPQIYANYSPEGSDFAVGLGINAPFGLSTDWMNSNAPFSRQTAGANSVTFSQIEAIQTNLNVAYKLTDHVSIAMGGVYYNATKVHLDNALVQVKGNGDGFGGNAAFLYHGENVSFGLNYRSKVKINISGIAEGLSPLPASFVGMRGGVTTSITLPDIMMVGLSWKAMPSLLLTAQADWVNWKTFDAINLHFQPSMLNVVTGTQKTVPENYKATTTYRFGAQWMYSNAMRARVGYVYDPTPTSTVKVSPRLPGNDRQLLTLGWGMDINSAMTMNLAYAYVWLKDRQLTTSATPIYNGQYTSNVHILSADLNYRF